MKIWAISDPHLGFGAEKMMDIFGKHWAEHPYKMAKYWREMIAEEDAVILPGDISWAINFEELQPDFAFLNSLPGHKYLGRGNHDYWWVSLAKNKAFCAENGFEKFEFLRSNAFLLPLEEPALAFNSCVLCGTRGWLTPYHSEWQASDEKYFQRELIRLKLALDAAEKVREEHSQSPLILALHYPPFGPNGEETEMTQLIEESQVSLCIYGHVHGLKARALLRLQRGLTMYLNTACDALEFKPLDLGAVLSDLLQ